MSSTSIVDADVDEEDSLIGDVVSPTSFASSVTMSTARHQIKVEEMKSAWDFPLIEKMGEKGSLKTQYWKCGWCRSTFKGWNVTKVLCHCTKTTTGKTDIKPCPGRIPNELLMSLIAFRNKKMDISTTKRRHDEAFADGIANDQMSISVALEGSRMRSSNSSNLAHSFSLGINDGGVSASNATKLTSAIAEFVYCKGLSFSSIEGTHFLQILRLAKLVPTTYCPPTRKVLANELLDLSYDNRMEKFMNSLESEADVYGLSLFGDGATVHGMPLMNILASGVHESSAVLAIIDCEFHVVNLSSSLLHIFNCDSPFLVSFFH
jgi:hypothetical protein